MPQRASLDAVGQWIERHVAPLASEPVLLAQAVGRVAADDVIAAARVPATDRAAIDGLALRAGETVGASAYNPLVLRLVPADGALPSAGAAAVLAAGAPLPAGADAIAALEQVQLTDGQCEIVEPVGVGNHVERAGAHVGVGDVLIAAGRAIDAAAAAVLATGGIATVSVFRRPRVRLVLTGRDLVAASAAATSAGTRDIDGVLLDGLIARDGGSIESARRAGRDRDALVQALRDGGADIILVIGGTGPGDDDTSSAALAATGELVIHGVAVRQCETAGVGHVAPGVPVFLLPGAPAACLWAYELIAGRAIRRRGGRSAALPFTTRRMALARKIASPIGLADVCPVAWRADGSAEPIASFAESGLTATVRADGVVIVPEGSEGYPRGAEVLVYLLRPQGCGA